MNQFLKTLKAELASSYIGFTHKESFATSRVTQLEE